MAAVSSIILAKFLLLLAGSSFALHPVHVSVTNIDVNTSKQEMSYSIRIFANDFEYALQHYYEKDIRLEDGISEDEKTIVIAYMDNAFKMQVNGFKCTPVCNNIAVQDNSIWIFFNSVLPAKELTSFKIRNTLLLDFFGDQTNLTIVTIDGKQSGYTFNYADREAEIQLN